MKILFKDNNKKTKDYFINSGLISNDIHFEFRTVEKNETKGTSIINKTNKNIDLKNKSSQKEYKRKIKFINSKFKFYQIEILIILLLIQSIFNSNCKNIIISKDSIITLKVSKTGIQKIFNIGTSPSEIWIDSIRQETVKNSYDLNPINTVKLIWANKIGDCNYMFKDCDTIIEMNFIKFDAK